MNRLENRKIHGAVPEKIDALVANALQTEVQTMKKKSLAAVVLAAALVLVLACTALAVSLNLSAQYKITQQAREAVMEKYGFTLDTLGLFYSESESGKDGGSTVYFRPIKHDDRLGTYTVQIDGKGNAAATWSHDGQDLKRLAEAGLDSHIWGPVQIGQALSLDTEYFARLQQLIEEKGNMYNWTLEERAELDEMLDGADYHLDAYGARHVVPGENDLTPDEAVSLAREAVMDKYGVTEAQLVIYNPYLFFMKDRSVEEPYYSITLTAREDPDDYETLDDYVVTVYSPTGEIGMCYRYAEVAKLTLPSGDLTGYEAAIEEFMQSGAFKLLSHEERSDLSDRITRAGYAKHLDGIHYAMPQEDMLTEAQALDAAYAALEERYGITEPMRGLFGIETALVQDGDTLQWNIDLVNDYMQYHRTYEFYEKLGEYHVMLDAKTGGVRNAYWMLENEALSSIYNETNWGSAPAWDAMILPWVLEFEQRLLDLEVDVDYDKGRTLEQNAAFSQLYRDAGFDREQYRYGLPGEGDLSQEEATGLAYAAISAEYGIDPDTLTASFRTHVTYDISDEKNPVWYFALYTQQPGRDDTYYVTVHAKTSEIVNMDYVAQGNG